jgi:cytochrome c peroxidase
MISWRRPAVARALACFALVASSARAGTPWEHGDNYTDSRFHDLGIGRNAGTQSFADPGRYAITKRDADRGAFKTPGLREVAQHAPYMHDGSIATLEEVVQHYDRGGIANPWLTTRVRKLDLTRDEVRALVAFMEALSGEGYPDRAPIAFPQSP